MGLSLQKLYCCTKRNRVTQSQSTFKILLLGLENSGKTEIGCILTGKKTTYREPTNGVQCYKMKLSNCFLAVTEVGGNNQMQKIWHHYFAKTMGLIYCYDMSLDLQQLQKSFQIFNQIASHPFMRGKTVLLIGTKSDLVNDTIQIFDIENGFAIEELANRYSSSLKSIHFSPSDLTSFWNGIHWLVGSIRINYQSLEDRIRYDNQIMEIQTQTKKQAHRPIQTRRGNFFQRPKTAPANLAPYEESSAAHEPKNNVFRIADTFM